jgi:hypothetical protein
MWKNAWCTGQIMTGKIFFCRWTFAWNSWKGEDGGCINFGNQELMENIQCITEHDFALYINNIAMNNSYYYFSACLSRLISLLFNSNVSVWCPCCGTFCPYSQTGGISLTSSIKYVLSITFESRANRRKFMARLSARNKRLLLSQTVRSCWETTRKSDRVQCSHCLESKGDWFLLPFLVSAQTVLVCCVVSVLAPMHPRPNA